jgi:hypothetical protein
MNDLNSVQLTGTIAMRGPTITATTDGEGEAFFVLDRGDFSIGVFTSSEHAVWVAASMSAGDTVCVDGQLRQDDGVLFIQAERISMLGKASREMP